MMTDTIEQVEEIKTDSVAVTEEDIYNFKNLFSINVNDKLEKKNGLAYLSWAWAWAETKKIDARASQKVHWFPFDGNKDVMVPYLKTPNGYFVQVSVTIHGHTETEMLPVLNHMNKPIANPNAFEINKNQKRCLVKAIALHGLGLYVYAGEDIPEGDTNTSNGTPNAPQGEMSVESLQKVVRGKKGKAKEKFNVTFDQIDEKIKEEIPNWNSFTKDKQLLETAKSLLESWGC